MYQSIITGLGAQVLDFQEENMLILFADNAPDALAEIAVLHQHQAPPTEEIKIGDQILFGEESYLVTAVGREANHTFQTMGHCTLRFDAQDEPNLPGEIQLSGEKFPTIEVGVKIEIQSK